MKKSAVMSMSGSTGSLGRVVRCGLQELERVALSPRLHVSLDKFLSGHVLRDNNGLPFRRGIFGGFVANLLQSLLKTLAELRLSAPVVTRT